MAGSRSTPSPLDGARFRVKADMVARVAVLTMTGRLGTEALEPCRTLIDTVLGCRPPGLVLDVRSIAVDPESASMLSLIRRYTVRRGTRLWLAAPSLRLVRALQEAHLSELYDLRPTVTAAVESALAAARTPALA